MHLFSIYIIDNTQTAAHWKSISNETKNEKILDNSRNNSMNKKRKMCDTYSIVSKIE